VGLAVGVGVGVGVGAGVGVGCGVIKSGVPKAMIAPKHRPHGSAAPMDLEFNGRPHSFFRLNSIVSVQNTQSGSSQSTTS